MNLVLVTETFPPEINGVAMTLSHLVEGLAKRGHTVTVARPRQSDADLPRADGLYEERLFPGFSIPGYAILKLGLPAARALRRWWKASPPDVVHIATEGPLGWSALRAARSLGIPVTSTFHTNFHHYGKHYGVGWLLKPALAYLRWFHNKTLVTLSPTASLNQDLAASGFERVGLLARGVNIDVFSPAKRDTALRAAWGAGPKDLVVLHVSRLAKEKNYPLLFRTFEALRKRDPKARFVVVSDGPLRKSLEREYPWAVFTGFLDRDALAAHYASADLFLYPSLTETFGNVATEAMASGLPVVAFNYAAPARFISDGTTGMLVPFGDEGRFVSTALIAASGATDRSAVGRAARKVAEGIPWSAVISDFEKALEIARSSRQKKGERKP